MKKKIIYFMLVSFLISSFVACTNSKLPNGRAKHQGCAQGKAW